MSDVIIAYWGGVIAGVVVSLLTRFLGNPNWVLACGVVGGLLLSLVFQ